MVCTSLIQLQKMAKAGSRKLAADSSNYSFKQIALTGNTREWTMTKNPYASDATEKVEYYVLTGEVKGCTCPFYQENVEQYGDACTCKHIEFLSDDLARIDSLCASVDKLLGK